MMRIAIVQMTAGTDPAANAITLTDAIAESARVGAAMLFTPEMSGILDRDTARLFGKVRSETEDYVLAEVCKAAREHAVWVALGSLAIKDPRADGRLVNRSFVIDAAGDIRARYDKIHLFDVEAAPGETYRESSSFAPGTDAVVVDSPLGLLGLSVCYDVRFPRLYDALTAAGARVIAVPAAFTQPTGRAHWHTLLRARAIESGAYIVAAAQTGLHEDGRLTFGHSLVIDPWGDVLLDMDEAPGIAVIDIDLARVDDVRRRIPALAHRRTIGVPA